MSPIPLSPITVTLVPMVETVVGVMLYKYTVIENSLFRDSYNGPLYYE